MHNAFRAKHNAPAMSTNATLVAAAQAWADRCFFEHGGGATIGAGENLSVSALESSLKLAIDAFRAGVDRGW